MSVGTGLCCFVLRKPPPPPRSTQPTTSTPPALSLRPLNTLERWLSTQSRMLTEMVSHVAAKANLGTTNGAPVPAKKLPTQANTPRSPLVHRSSCRHKLDSVITLLRVLAHLVPNGPSCDSPGHRAAHIVRKRVPRGECERALLSRIRPERFLGCGAVWGTVGHTDKATASRTGVSDQLKAKSDGFELLPRPYAPGSWRHMCSHWRLDMEQLGGGGVNTVPKQPFHKGGGGQIQCTVLEQSGTGLVSSGTVFSF